MSNQYFGKERRPGDALIASAPMPPTNYGGGYPQQHQPRMASQQGGGYYPQYQNPQAPPPPGWMPPTQQNYGQPSPSSGPGVHYAEGGVDKANFNFNDATIRAAFIRKVFTLVTIMLTVVAIMTAVPWTNDNLLHTVRTSFGLYIASYVTFLVVYLALVCCESVRRSFPANLILTALLTLSIGYMTAMISAHHNIVSVVLCAIITAACCGTITVFSMQTKHDLTSKMGVLFIASMLLMIFGLVAIVAAAAFKVKFLYTIYAGLAAILFMFYLAVDIQMIMGGRKYEISPEDHIFAAVQLFIDVVYIFWMLLALFGGSRD